MIFVWGNMTMQLSCIFVLFSCICFLSFFSSVNANACTCMLFFLFQLISHFFLLCFCINTFFSSLIIDSGLWCIISTFTRYGGYLFTFFFYIIIFLFIYFYNYFWKKKRNMWNRWRGPLGACVSPGQPGLSMVLLSWLYL